MTADRTLRVLHVEDSEADVSLLARHLSRAGYNLDSERVETAEAMRAALDARTWDVILCDYSMPHFDAMAALSVLKGTGLDIPFIIVSGTVGEEMAVEAMRAGAQDYLMKENLARLVPTIEREVAESENRRARRSAEEKYRAIFENAVEGIFQSTPEGRFISVNPAMARILGFDSPEDLMEHRKDIATEHYADPEARARLLRVLAEEGVVAGHECEVFRKDQSRIWVLVNLRAIRDRSGSLLCYEGSLEDTTERKMLEEQLRQSQKLEAVGQLAGGIAHDFNNLLTAILGYSDLAIRRLNAEDPLHRNLSEIKRAAERASSLTSQLLAFSRKQILQPKVINLNSIVSDMDRMLRRLIGEDIDLLTKTEPELGSVKADPGQIEQVLLNLAINARDAMHEGGKLTIETANVSLGGEYAVRHVGNASGDYVMLAVSDTGTGMDDETRARCFEPFFTTKEVGRGTGLGLSTVYGIVTQSGGNIWVYSEVGRGTTFKIYLPRIDTAADETASDARSAQTTRGTETILLAEDDDSVRKLACEVLEMGGYQVLEAANGGAAFLICERHEGRIDMLLTDVVMPEMSGRELWGRLNSMRPGMRALYMSGYTGTAVVRNGVLACDTNFIQKPFSPEGLLQKVRQVLDL